jgi:hypothetical protein
MPAQPATTLGLGFGDHHFAFTGAHFGELSSIGIGRPNIGKVMKLHAQP